MRRLRASFMGRGQKMSRQSSMQQREIRRRHLVPQLPLAENVSIDQLAAYADDICGRDIRNAIIDAAVRVARYGKAQVELRDLIEAVDRIKAARIAVKSHEGRS